MNPFKNLSVRQINKLFRAGDESHKWPVCGRFNVTERAIRRIRRLRRQGLELNSGTEYADTLEQEISQIVNASC